MLVTDTNSPAAKLPDFLQSFASAFGDGLVAVEEFQSEITLVVRPGIIREVIQFLKSDPSTRCEMMLDLYGMDYLKYEPAKPERFAVVYQFYSLTHHRHLRLKTYLPEATPELQSIHDIYKAANWFEREAWDLFGVVFHGHPNLVRILCHTEFVGHALRKDYPSDGYQRLKNAAPSTGF